MKIFADPSGRCTLGRVLFCWLLLSCATLPAFGQASSSTRTSLPVFDRFRATIGVDDGVLGRQGTVRFIVQVDGKEVLHTEVMRPGDPARPVDIALNGAHSLRLIVDDAGDGHGGDWGDWADARLLSTRTGNILFLSDLDAVVEQEWIPTRMDRNLVQDPITLNGIVYERGLGADSGSSMLYESWENLWRARQEKEEAAERAGSIRWGPLVLRGAPGADAKVFLNDTDVTSDLRQNRSVAYPAGAVLQIHAEQPPAGASLVGPQVFGALRLQSRNGTSLSLQQAMPARIETPIPEGVSALPGNDLPVVLNGSRYLGPVSTGLPVTLTYRDLARALDEKQALTGSVHATKRLQGTVGLDEGQTTRYGLVRFRIFAGDRLLWQSRPATHAAPPQRFDLPLDSPDLLRLELDSAGDGIYRAEGDWADLHLTDSHSRRLAALSDFRPFAQRQNWGTPQRNRSAGQGPLILGGKVVSSGLGTAANSVVIYREIDRLVSDRLEAEQQVKRALTASSETQALAALNRAAVLCPELASLYIARAQVEQANHHPEAARTAWQRLLDIASATPDQRRQAQQALEPSLPYTGLKTPFHRVETLFTGLKPRAETISPPERAKALSAALSPDEEEKSRLQGQSAQADFAPLLLRLQPPVTNRGQALLRTGNGNLFSIDLQPAKRLSQLTPPGAQEGFADFSSDPADAGKWLTIVLNSRGLEINTYLTAEGKPQRPLTPLAHGRNPTLRWQVRPGRYRLVVTHDPGKDNHLLPWTLDGVAVISAPSPTPPPKPTERWRYTIRNDGSALVSVTVDGPDVILLPKTAQSPTGTGTQPRYRLDTPEAVARLSPSAFAYDSVVDGNYTLGDGLLLAPGPGQKQASLSFVWPDAAYDVPITHYATDHVKKHFFASLKGIDPDAAGVDVTVVLPASATKASRTVPPAAPEPVTPGSGPIYHWALPPDKPAILDAENPQLTTAWISAQHRHMTVWLPDCPEYRRWQPEYMSLLGRIYDRESAVMGGYQTQDERFIYVTGPAQLSGYGGATWGDPKLSETWIACDGRVGAYNLQAQPGGDGVEAHELKWVHLGGTVPDLPRWLQDGTIIWMEEQGKLAGGTAFADYWTWNELAPKSKQYEVAFAGHGPGSGFVWMDAAAFGKLTAEEKSLTSAMDWRICQTLFERYGETFWPRFWQKERQSPNAFKNLSEDAKTRKVVEDMVTLTGDPAVRDLFRRWGFRL